MQLTPPNRREVIEDLLDIRIFSTMNTILKDKFKVVREDIREYDYQFQIIREKVEMQQRFIDDLKEQSQANNRQRKTEIKSIEDEISLIVTSVADGLEECASLQQQLDEYESCDDELGKLKIYQSKFEDKKHNLKKEYKFFEKNSVCPTCKQDITDDLRDNKKDGITKSLTELSKASTDLKEKVNEITAQVRAKQDLLNKVRSSQEKISANNREIQWKRDAIQKIERAIEGSSGGSNITREKTKLKDLAQEGLDIEQKLSKQKKTRNDYDVVANMLKDTGIKAGIIKRYLPVMNQLINRYLKELDFYVSFDLDENFEETIKSRFRDEFTYSSFSEGEKMRIDLALLFTWRTIAKMKNSANTNLLILDEIFDSSLDTSGTDDFMKILHTVSDKTNVFVISHKTDALQDKFASTLHVEKKQNFSVITREE
tara:strand:+ start:1 stop:1284 length:1284 start_codon:yes stop_codon:yes gene_type:complete